MDRSEIKKSGIDDYSKLKDLNEKSDSKENKKTLNPINSSIADG